MKKRRVLVLCVAALAMLGAAWSRWGRSETVQSRLDMVRERGNEVLVGSGPSLPQVVWAGTTVSPTAAQRKRMAKCPITSGTYGGSLSWEITVWDAQSPLQSFAPQTTGGALWMDYMGTGTGTYLYRITLVSSDGAGSLAQQDIEIPVPETGQEQTYHWTWAWSFSGAALDVVAGSSPIGEKANATHAKERTVAESWSVPAGSQIAMSVTGDCGVSLSSTETVSSSALSMHIGPVALTDPGDFPEHNKVYIAVRDIKFCGEEIDTTSYPAQAMNGEGASENSWLRSDGSSGFEFYDTGIGEPGGVDTWGGETVYAPYSYDFSNLAFKWLDGTDVDDSLEVYCTGIRRLNGSGIDIGPWHGSVAALKALGRVTQKYGVHSWDTWDDDMSNVVALYLDLTSAEALGLDIRGPQPQYKVEGAGWSGGTLWSEGYVSPVDGAYAASGICNGEPCFSNGQFVLYKVNDDGDYGIGPATNMPPYYLQEGAGPPGAYLVNTAYWADDVIDEETGQRRFSGLSGEGVGPAVTASTEEAITVDSDLATPAFNHDGTFVFDAWPLSATNRTDSPNMTDVVSLTADDAKSVYGDAHDHTDWVVTNGTGPDAGGNFTIGTGGGSLKLTLKCNYRDRQAEAKGTGHPNAVPVPACYHDRRHDTHLGGGTTPETAEAVWDWRGYYLAQSFYGLSLPCDVTCNIVYYMDLLGCGDNHSTENKRQTEYTYSPGDQYTLTRTLPVSWVYPNDYEIVAARGFAPIIVDLYDEGNAGQPVAMAYSLEWELPEGTYKLGAPTLQADGGDRQEVTTVDPYYREEPETSGFSLKIDESPGYAQGLVSAHINGLSNMALFVPDNAKSAVIEKTFDTLNVLHGEELDLTSNYSLAGWPVTNSGERWTLTYSSTAEAAHMTDEDDATLKALQCLDLCPQEALGTTGYGPLAIPVAVRCYQITCVRGLPYTFYGKKIVGGRGHGMSLTTQASAGTGQAFPRSRFGSAGTVWRRPLGSGSGTSYEQVTDEPLTANEHGHWETPGLPVLGTTETRPLWEYFMQPEAGTYNSMGRFATREWAMLQAFITGTPLHPFLREGAASRLYAVCVNPSNKVALLRLPYGKTWDAADTTFAATGLAEWPALAYVRPVMQGAILHGTTAQAASWWRSDANEWETEQALATLGLSYPYPDYGLAMDVVSVGGYKDGGHYYGRLDANSGAVRDCVKIADGDDAPGALSLQRELRLLLYALPNGADIDLYASRDDGQTWSYQAKATGIACPALDCTSPYRFYLAGYAGGSAVVERWNYEDPVARLSTGRWTIAAADEDRPAFAMHRAGLGCVALLNVGGALKEYRSEDDGETWTLQGTVATA